MACRAAYGDMKLQDIVLQILESKKKQKKIAEDFLDESEKRKTSSGERGCKSFTTVCYNLLV